MSSSYIVAEVLTFEKTLIDAGSGKYQPNEFSQCAVVIHCNDGVSDVIGYALDERTTVIIGSGKTYAACVIDVCLQTMKEGEKCLLNIPCNELTKSSSHGQLELEMTLLSVEHNVEIYTTSVSEKVSRASILKELGAAAFKSGDTVVAFYKFSRSLKYLTCALDKEDCELSQETNCTSTPARPMLTNDSTVCQPVTLPQVDEMVCQCLLNIAACQLRHKNYEMAQTNCTCALAIDPLNVKGLFRRARCFLELRQEELAVSDLERAVSLEPGNREIVKLLSTAKDAVRQNDKKLAIAMGKMFQST